MSERERLERVRRILLAFVAVVREQTPGGQLTLDVQIVARRSSRPRRTLDPGRAIITAHDLSSTAARP